QAAVRRALGGPAAPAGPVVQQQKLTAGATGLFGWSVAISGSTAVVGADTTGSPNRPRAGYGVPHPPSSPLQQHGPPLTDPNGAANADRFGSAVAIWGSTVLVGASGVNSGTGAVYVYARSGGIWTPQTTLHASPSVPGGAFGSAVAITGSTVVQ